MSDRTLRYGVIFDVIFKSEVFMDYDIQKITEKKIRFCLRYILYGHKFTKSEKQYINDFANNFIDRRNIKEGSNKRRKCKICKNMVVATSYCESCMRNCLIKKFDNWTSGNEEIDQLIQFFQKKAFNPRDIIEWVPYEDFIDIKYKAEGGNAKIYTATRKYGPYNRWNSNELKLERRGDQQVALKEIRKTNERWLDEVKSHCEININSDFVIGCYGLTKNPETNEFMLILSQYKYDLREYMAKNHSSLSLLKKLKIIHDDLDLAINILNGIRPEIPNKFPDKLKKLLKQCWDAIPDNRPDAKALWIETKGILRDLYNKDQNLQIKVTSKITINFANSKLHYFSNLPSPKNATQEQQEGKICLLLYA
ncbi:14513_t:CDS:2 [Entrophospora sp. SA101]|nr:14513_t:CDS:2 [Entrophospora sp. SA101]